MKSLIQLEPFRKAIYSFLLQEVVSSLQWRELEQTILNRSLEQDRATCIIDILPVLTCMALGGKGEAAIPLAAMWVLYLITGRIFDNLQDKNAHPDRNQLLNVGLGILACAQIPLSTYFISHPLSASTILKQCGHAAANAARSQAEEWIYIVPPPEVYFENIHRKSGNFFGTYAWSGGCVSSPDPSQTHLKALYNYGFSAGIMAQIEDDCDDLGEDIDRGFFTLPVIYAMSKTDNPTNLTLAALLTKGKLSHLEKQAVVEILDLCGAVNMAMQVAWLYKSQAQDSLKDLPDSEAKKYLEAYVT